MPYKKLIALDFDGVLHSYTSPWSDAATISDGPTPSAMQFLWDLSDDDRFKVVIVSSRLSEYAGLQAMKRWIEHHATACFGAEIADGFVPFLDYSKIRPPAFLTIDDRAMTFTGVWPSLNAIAGFVPWNKRPAGETECLTLTVDLLREVVEEAWRDGNEVNSLQSDKFVRECVDKLMPGLLRGVRDASKEEARKIDVLRRS